MNNNIIALWRPIYIEPIIDSGEKICVGICYNLNGDIFYKQTLRDELCDFVYLRQEKSMRNIVKYSCEYAVHLIRKEKLHDNSNEILPGIYVGAMNKSEGPSIENIHARVSHKLSFFNNIDINKADQSSSKNKGLKDLILEDMINKKSPLAKNFNIDVEISGIKKTIDYIDTTNNFAANFFQFQNNCRIYKAEVSSLSLSMLSDTYQKRQLITTIEEKYKIKQTSQRTTKEVEDVARHLNIKLIIMDSREEIIDHLEAQAA